MTNHTHITFPNKKAVEDRDRRLNNNNNATVASHERTEEEDDKHILADRYKTKMCKNFVAHGECPYEERCMFAHGDGELRTSGDNIRDGLVTEEAIKSFQRQQNQAKRRATFGSARDVQAHRQTRTTAAPVSHPHAEAMMEEAPVESVAETVEQMPEEMEAYYEVPMQQQQMVPGGAMSYPHHSVYVHNPYAFDLIPAEAREYDFYAEVPQTYWYAEPTVGDYAEDDYYFPSSDILAPLVPSSITQQQQQQQMAATASFGSMPAGKMFHSATQGSLGDEAVYGQSESSDFSGYNPVAHCAAAEVPNYTEEAPMVMEP